MKIFIFRTPNWKILKTNSIFFIVIIFYGLCYYSCPAFSPFATLHPEPPTPSSNPPTIDCSCPWVMCLSSLATPFSILYCTSPWLFCNYLFVLLNSLTSSPLHPFSLFPLPPGTHLVINFFSLAAFKSLSLSLIFGLLIMMCLGVGLFDPS